MVNSKMNRCKTSNITPSWHSVKWDLVSGETWVTRCRGHIMCLPSSSFSSWGSNLWHTQLLTLSEYLSIVTHSPLIAVRANLVSLNLRLENTLLIGTTSQEHFKAFGDNLELSFMSLDQVISFRRVEIPKVMVNAYLSLGWGVNSSLPLIPLPGAMLKKPQGLHWHPSQ